MTQLVENQIVIQALLVGAVIVTTFMLTRSTAGVRGLALRRILTLLFAVFAIVAILSPASVTSVARMVGVTRGADLLLYVLIIAFFGYIIISQRRNAVVDRQLTLLSRKLALLEAPTEAEVESADTKTFSPEDLAPVGEHSRDAHRFGGLQDKPRDSSHSALADGSASTGQSGAGAGDSHAARSDGD